jgi:prophage antirepressor-like protein
MANSSEMMAPATSKWAFEGRQMRIEMIDGEPWFVAKDVCECLGLGNPTEALKRLDDEESTLISIEGASNGLPVNAVNESGLYNLILGSRKPEAKRFKRWVTHEVLPSIRKHGGYILESKLTEMQRDPRVMGKLYMDLADEMDKRKAAERRLDEMTVVATEQDGVIQRLLPKAQYMDQVLQPDNLLSVNVAAADLGVSAIKLNKFMVAHKLVYKQGKVYIPGEKIKDKGFFDYKSHVIALEGGQSKTVEHLYLTQTGRKFVAELFDKERGPKLSA